MINAVNTVAFYPPNTKELGLGTCYVLDQSGGQLTFERVTEVLADFFRIPEDITNIQRTAPPLTYTEWSYVVAWACSGLRKKGFMARNTAATRGMCILTEHGHELGSWAEQIYRGDNPVLPDWVGAFLKPLRARIKSLLGGGRRRKPPDYELCRWVRYCYLLNWPEQGIAISNLILSDHVEPRLYSEVQRQARTLKTRMQEQASEPAVTPLPPTAQIATPQNVSDIQQWITHSFPPGTRIPTLVRAGHNEIESINEAGIVIVPSRTNQSKVVTWNLVESAYRELQESGYVSQHTLGFRGNFLCSLLASLPGTERVPGECAVQLVEAVQPNAAGLLTDEPRSIEDDDTDLEDHVLSTNDEAHGYPDSRHTDPPATDGDDDSHRASPMAIRDR